MATLTQEQLNRFFEIISSSVLNSEIPTELTQIVSDSNYIAIQKGVEDAKKIKTSALRGYLGGYDANTNSPSLVDGVGVDGDKYIVTVAGIRNFGSGSISLDIDDFVRYVSGKWRKASLTTKTSQLINDSSDGVNFYNSRVNISGYVFSLHKLDLDPAKRNTLEVGDDVIGKDDLGNLMMARYKGGTSSDFQNDAVWERFGGY